MLNLLQWLETWFSSHCDVDWEQENGIKIETLGNPGWNIEIDLLETVLESYEFDMDTVEVSENDWYFYKIENGKFIASGDPSKLEFLLNKFRELVEEHTKAAKNES